MRYKPEIIAYITANYKLKTDQAIFKDLQAQGFKIFKNSIKTIRLKYNLRRSHAEGLVVKSSDMHPPEVIAYIKAHYKTKSDAVIRQDLIAQGHELAVSAVKRIRKKNKLKRTDNETYLINAEQLKAGGKPVHFKYPQEVVAYIKANYKLYPNRVIGEGLQALGYTISDNTVNSILSKYNLKRTPEDLKNIMKVLVDTGVKRNAIIKGHEESRDQSLKIGEIGIRRHGEKRRWVIKLGHYNYRRLDYWLWEQAGGALPPRHHLEWIDESAPPTIENLRIVPTYPNVAPIGHILYWMHEGRERAYIKLGPGHFMLYFTYLWNKHHGEVPPGYYVEKIDPCAPTTIDNLHVVNRSKIAEGSSELADWFVLGTANHGYGSETKEALKQLPDFIEIQRLRIELARLLKEKTHGKSSTAPRNTIDNKVEGTSTENGG